MRTENVFGFTNEWHKPFFMCGCEFSDSQYTLIFRLCEHYKLIGSVLFVWPHFKNEISLLDAPRSGRPTVMGKDQLKALIDVDRHIYGT